jgi:hypothetical protein
MLKTYAVTVRWAAVAERVEYVSAASVEEACTKIRHGEWEDAGDIDYYEDDSSDHWITSIVVPSSDHYDANWESLPVPAEHQHKYTAAEAADELLKACRMAVSAFGNQAHTPAGEQAIAAIKAAINVAEEAT